VTPSSGRGKILKNLTFYSRRSQLSILRVLGANDSFGYYVFVERALGFRAEARHVYWAVVEGTRHDPILIEHGKAAAPVDLDEAPALSWYASRVRLIVETHKPIMAAVRFPESFALGTNKESARRRLRIEGVLLQAIDSCGLKVITGALAMISGKLGSQAKKYVESGEVRGLDLSGLPAPAREAVLVAIAALPRDS
jgi:hypothetical protein